jgi:dihydrofolate synthase/folylpolyglutamate synthase
MDYQQTLDYFYSQLPMFSRIGSAAYKEDLHNTIALCESIGNPQTKFKSVHIAGTNGKGSTSHMLAAILQSAGYKTGLYTSPHLKDFRERIKMNGEMIEKDFVVEFAERTKKITADIQPSFFELTVAMAFEYFATEQVDIAIIETGLGGRLDSTNMITPILSIITNIGYDHINILGNTLQEIASEKAGIIKPNVPVIIGEYLEETKPIFIAKAKEMNAPIYFAQEQFNIYDVRYTIYDLRVDVEDVRNKCRENFTLDLNGLYQIKNLLTVLSAESILMKHGFTITNEAEKYGYANVKKLTGLHGRWDVIHENPVIVLDVGHNEDGIKQILNSKAQIPNSKTHFVIGLVKDKDIDKVLALLPKESSYYFTQAHIPRALPANELRDKAATFNLEGDYFDNVNEAINAAKQKAAKDDLIIVCGSVFLVGEVEASLIV